MAYTIKLDIFEGPLDLLLHLIKRNEVDIYDIPIAVITEQYLAYVDMMKEMNLDLAGEFLVMAATLVHIKSRMLLPVTEEAEGEEAEGPDPRAELVEKLLEYQRYKEAAAELADKNMLGRDVFARGSDIQIEGVEEAGLTNVSVFDLVDALKEILARAPKETAMELTADRFRIADKINHILDRLGATKSAPFTSLFPDGATRGEIIVTFLAVLELAKLLLIKAYQTEDGVIRVYTSGGGERTVDAEEISSGIEGPAEGQP